MEGKPKIGDIQYVGVAHFPIIYGKCPDCGKLTWTMMINSKPTNCGCKETAEDILLRWLWDAN
jgi:hypothetical protein